MRKSARLEAIKAHIKANKEKYIIGALAATTAALTAVVIKQAHENGQLEHDNEILAAVCLDQEGDIYDLNEKLDWLHDCYSWVNNGKGL